MSYMQGERFTRPRQCTCVSNYAHTLLFLLNKTKVYTVEKLWQFDLRATCVHRKRPNPLSHTAHRLTKYTFFNCCYIDRKRMFSRIYLHMMSNSFLSLTASWAFEKKSQKLYSDIAFDSSSSLMMALMML